VMGLPIPAITVRGPSASAVILADRASETLGYAGLAEALATPGGEVDVRIFGKPNSRPYRRMGVALALAESTDAARRIAAEAAAKVRIGYGD
jgi:phosphoribosylglycinamide formyltransferase 2